MYYTRLSEGFNKPYMIPEGSDIYKFIGDRTNKPWFISTHLYTEEQKKIFDETGSVKGFTDLVGKKLIWDFDSEENLEIARNSAIQLIKRLSNDEIPDDCIKVQYSGAKGIHVILDIDKEVTPVQSEVICTEYAKDLPGFDTTMYDRNQIIRLALTKHNSGNYCFPVTVDELHYLTMDDIVERSKRAPEVDYKDYIEYYQTYTWAKPLPVVVKTLSVAEPTEYKDEPLNMKKKPSFVDDVRWHLMNGYFKVGERSLALLCIASTLKNVGFPQPMVFRMLKAMAQMQADKYKIERFPDDELHNNILMQVYSPTWKNGQFTLRDPNSWLYKYAVRNKLNTTSENGPIQFLDIESQFISFVKNIDQNTILTGLPSIDAKMHITTGMMMGVVGAASSGKTSLCLEMLKNTSKAGVTSVFASLDMYKTRIFEKLIYKVTKGMDKKEVYEIYRTGRQSEISKKIKEDYGNVWFYDRSSPSVTDIRDYVLEVQQKSGNKVKLLMIDYFERVGSDVADATAASKKVSAELQDLMNDLDLCIVIMYQPNKASLAGGPDMPILNYSAIKGSSFVFQSLRQIISIWRPFFGSHLKDNDRYMQCAILKNDLGELDIFDFNWCGKTGAIEEMEDHERTELHRLIDEKESNKRAEKEDGGW